MLGFLSEREYETRLKRLQIINRSKERKRKLKEEKHKNVPKLKTKVLKKCQMAV